MNRLLKLLAASCVAMSVWGCTVSSTESTEIETVQTALVRIGTTAQGQLIAAKNDFLAATPPSTHGADCVGALPDATKPGDLGTGVLSVLAAIQREEAANPQGAGISGFEAIAKTTIYQPGSAQFNWAMTQVETGCIALIHDENQSINSTAGIFTALPSILGLAAAPAGL